MLYPAELRAHNDYSVIDLLEIVKIIPRSYPDARKGKDKGKRLSSAGAPLKDLGI